MVYSFMGGIWKMHLLWVNISLAPIDRKTYFQNKKLLSIEVILLII